MPATSTDGDTYRHCCRYACADADTDAFAHIDVYPHTCAYTNAHSHVNANSYPGPHPNANPRSATHRSGDGPGAAAV